MTTAVTKENPKAGLMDKLKTAFGRKQDSDAKQRKADWAAYQKILRRMDNSHAGDADRLVMLCETLDRDEADVANDASIVVEFLRLERLTAELPALESEHEQLKAVATGAWNKTEAARKVHAEACEPLAELAARIVHLNDVAKDVRSLRTRNPDLFND